MSTFGAVPGESNAQIISSIINLICPQCGGRMSEFQCEGRCCRNWLADGNGQIMRRDDLSPGRQSRGDELVLKLHSWSQKAAERMPCDVGGTLLR
jgi:hypothetical protein